MGKTTEKINFLNCNELSAQQLELIRSFNFNWTNPLCYLLNCMPIFAKRPSFRNRQQLPRMHFSSRNWNNLMKIELFAFCYSSSHACLASLKSRSRSFLFRPSFSMFFIHIAVLAFSTLHTCCIRTHLYVFEHDMNQQMSRNEKYLANNINKRKWFYLLNRKRSLWMMKKRGIWSKSQN